MHQVAEYFNSLNANGNVRAILGNEQGYARILDLATGCSFFLRHETDDRLCLALMMTRRAQRRYPELCKLAIAAFEEQFPSQVQYREFINAMNQNEIRDLHYIDIQDQTTTQIIASAQAMKDRFETLGQQQS
jgi:hypothetical protein